MIILYVLLAMFIGILVGGVLLDFVEGPYVQNKISQKYADNFVEKRFGKYKKKE